MSNSAAQPLVDQAARSDAADDSFFTQFTQQRLKAWNTALPPFWVISLYLGGGVFCLVIGGFLLYISQNVQEYSKYYTDAQVDDNGVATIELTITDEMQPPIWVYYQLDSFHQNHRRYVKSRDDHQLAAHGNQKLAADQLRNCQPAVVGDGKRPFYPCGLVARSVFNDSFAFVAKGPNDDDQWAKLEIDSTAKTIAWSADLEHDTFKNYDPEEMAENGEGPLHTQLDMWLTQRFPPVMCQQKELTDEKMYKPAYVGTKSVDLNGKSVTVADCKGYSSQPECNFVDRHGNDLHCDGEYEKKTQEEWGVESGHFIVWMRVAGLPSFRKLWGKIDQTLEAGTKLKVYIANNFPVKEFDGQKAVVLSTSSSLGGRNDFLGGGYIAVGICCLLFGSWFIKSNL
jgi:hypothetical protein